jgi:hypothetical protein
VSVTADVTVDESAVTDTDRAELGVPPLSESRELASRFK